MGIDELYDKSLKIEYNIADALPALRLCNDGAVGDVLNVNGCNYYQWSPRLLEVLKPKQVVELGGAMGVWSLMLLNGKYQDFDLHSITLAEHGLEFCWIDKKYKNFHPVVGNDLDLSNWGDLDLSKTDLWFFDALHTEEHLRKELDLYSPFFKKGTVILIDDIHSFGLDPVWEDLKAGRWGKMQTKDITDPMHYSGYGMAIYDNAS